MTNNKTTLESILRDIQTINTLAQEVGTKVAMLKNKETLSELDDPRIDQSHRPAEQAVARAENKQARSLLGGRRNRKVSFKADSQTEETREPSSDVSNMINDMFV